MENRYQEGPIFNEGEIPGFKGSTISRRWYETGKNPGWRYHVNLIMPAGYGFISEMSEDGLIKYLEEIKNTTPAPLSLQSPDIAFESDDPSYATIQFSKLDMMNFADYVREFRRKESVRYHKLALKHGTISWIGQSIDEILAEYLTTSTNTPPDKIEDNEKDIQKD
jgi:hypothetical protein